MEVVPSVRVVGLGGVEVDEVRVSEATLLEEAITLETGGPLTEEWGVVGDSGVLLVVLILLLVVVCCWPSVVVVAGVAPMVIVVKTVLPLSSIVVMMLVIAVAWGDMLVVLKLSRVLYTKARAVSGVDNRRQRKQWRVQPCHAGYF